VKAITTKGARQRQILLAMHSNNSRLWLTMGLHGMARASFILSITGSADRYKPGPHQQIAKTKRIEPNI